MKPVTILSSLRDGETSRLPWGASNWCEKSQSNFWHLVVIHWPWQDGLQGKGNSLATYLFPNLKGSFSFTFYFLEGVAVSENFTVLQNPCVHWKPLQGWQRHPCRGNLHVQLTLLLLLQPGTHRLIQITAEYQQWATNGIIYISLQSPDVCSRSE